MAKHVYQLVNGDNGEIFDTFSTLKGARDEAQTLEDEGTFDAGEELHILIWQNHLESHEACIARGHFVVWWIRVYEVKN